MRQIMNMSLAVLLVGSSALLADERKGPAPMDRLAQGVDLIGKGTYDQALTHILWCFDQSDDAEFQPVRETTVIDALALLVEVHPPTVTALKARRDTAMAQAGNPPKISPAFYDVLALNRALGEDTKSDELIRNAVSAGSIKTFSSKTPVPTRKAILAQEARSTGAPQEAMKAIERSKRAAEEIILKSPVETRKILAANRAENMKDRWTLTSKNREITHKVAEWAETMKRAEGAETMKRAEGAETMKRAEGTEVMKSAERHNKSFAELQHKYAIEAQKAIADAVEVLDAERAYLFDLEKWNETRTN